MTGLSESYINKVRRNDTKGFDEGTVNKVKFLLSLEVNYLNALFARADFADICILVMKSSSKRHHKNIVNIIRFADKCLRRHNTLRKEFNVRGVTDDDFNAAELMGIYMADIKKLFKDELFYEMCSVAILIATKDYTLRSYASYLMDISDMIKDLHKSKEKKGVE